MKNSELTKTARQYANASASMKLALHRIWPSDSLLNALPEPFDGDSTPGLGHVISIAPGGFVRHAYTAPEAESAWDETWRVDEAMEHYGMRFLVTNTGVAYEIASDHLRDPGTEVPQEVSAAVAAVGALAEGLFDKGEAS